MIRLIFLIFLLPVISFAQSDLILETEANQLNFEKAISLEKITDSQLDSLHTLIHSYTTINADSSVILVEKALKLLETNANKSLQANTFIRAGDVYRQIGEWGKSEEALIEAKAIAKSIKDEYIIAQADNLLGIIAMNTGEFEQALKYLISAAKTFEFERKKDALAKANFNIATIFFNMNELNKAQKYLNKVSALVEELDDDKWRFLVLGLRGNILMHKGGEFMSNPENSEFAQDSFDYYLNKTKEAYLTALELTKNVGDKQNEVLTLNNLVALYMNMGNAEDAVKTAKEAEIKALELGITEMIIQSKFNLSAVYGEIGDYDKAERYGEESLGLAKKYKLERKESLANNALYGLYLKSGSFEKAIEYLNKIRTHEKKISDVERKKAMGEIEAKFETVKKEKQILELSAAKATAEKQRNFMLGGGLLIGLLGFFGFRLNRVRKERNDKKEFAEALIFAQEEERKRIARDLHDGVGQSLLLMKKQMTLNHETTLENQKLITDTLEEVRSISRDLHPFQLEKFGLTAAIKDVLLKVEKSTDLFLTSEIDNIDNLLSEKAQINFYRTIQEAMNNIVKHAEATAARILIEKTDREINVKIMDDGKGFDHELAIIKSKSLGLRTMFERVLAIGGKLKIKPNLPEGTIVEFNVPIV